MTKAVDQDVYERVFNTASELAFAARVHPNDTLSGPTAAMLFALLNAWERESVHEDNLSAAISAADKFAVAYEVLWMEVAGQ